MEAVVLETYGTPDVLKVVEMPMPKVGAEDILVRVHASSVNPVDIGVRQGRILPSEPSLFPMILGWDAAGVVEEMGGQVTDFSKGDRVVLISKQPSTGRGTHAEFVSVPAKQAVALPSGIDFAEAATIPLAGLTALQAIKALSLSSGQTILINNPLGAVGGFAVQIAQQLGLKVFAPVKHDFAEEARSLGVETILSPDATLSGTVRAFVEKGVDGALDLVGAETAHQTLASVKDSGTYATVLPEWWKPGGPYAEARGIVPTVVEIAPDATDLAMLVDLLNCGKLSTRIERTFKLHELPEAHAFYEKPGLCRKLAIDHI